MENKAKARITEIDIAKGLNIILVIIGHLVIYKGVVFREIFSFHMPFFFIMSGYCSPNGKSELPFSKFILNLAKDLLVPSLIVRIILSFYCNQMTFWDGVKNIFLVPSTEWFFASLFVARFLFYFIKRYFASAKIWLYIVLILILPLMAKIYYAKGLHNSPTLIFPIDCALIALSFVLIGAILRKLQDTRNITMLHIYSYFAKHKLLLGICMIISFFLVQYNDYVNICDLYTGKSCFLFYELAVLGSFFMLLLSIWLNQRFPKTFLLNGIKIFGRYTKIIYPGHAFLHIFFIYIIFKITGNRYQTMIDMPAVISVLFFLLDILIFSFLFYFLENRKRVTGYELDKYLGLASIIVGILSVEAQLLGEVYYSNLLFITFLLLYACMIIHMICSKIINQKKLVNIFKQLFVINLLIALFWDASALNRIHIMESVESVNFVIMVLGLLIWNISTLIFGIRIYTNGKGRILEKCKAAFKYNSYIFILLFIVCILYIPCFSYWFKSDSNVYYTDIVMKQGNWDFTIGSALSNFTLGGHLCYGYSFFMSIGQGFFPTNGIGIRFVILLLYLVTIFLFSKILERLFPAMGKLENVLVTGVFTFTPIVFGILFETNIDFPLLCFWTWFIYCHLTGNQILRLFTGVLTCFSKELGVLFIVGFFISNYLYDLICIDGKISILPKIDRIFQSIRLTDFFTCFSSAFLFFICSIFAKEGWASSTITAPEEIKGTVANTIQFSLTYILIKLKQIFILNFQWLFLIIAVLFLVLLLLKRIKLCITQMGFTLFVLFGGFLCFNFFYFTWPHARYLQIEAFFFCIFLGYSLRLILKSKKILNISLSVILGIHILSCFVLVDPLSYLCFKNINIGSRQLISITEYSTIPDTGAIMFTEKENPKVDLNNHILRDFVQYNREYTHLEELIERMFAEINYNEEIAVFIPPLFTLLDDDDDTENLNTKYTYDNIFGFVPEKAYWNPKNRNIYYHPNDSANPDEVKINWLTQDDINKSVFKKYSQVVYLDFPYQTKWDKENFIKKYKIERTIKKEYFGWTLEAHYIIPKVKGKEG